MVRFHDQVPNDQKGKKNKFKQDILNIFKFQYNSLNDFVEDLKDNSHHIKNMLQWAVINSPAGHTHLIIYSQILMLEWVKQSVLFIDDSFDLDIAIADCKKFISLLLLRWDKVYDYILYTIM